jgi:hypothetical protein
VKKDSRMDRVSTADDIKKLEALDPHPGDTLTWEALEEILGISRQERRFRTVYRAWIRHLRKWRNLKMVVLPGVGLRVLAEHERAGDVCQTLGRTWHLFERAKTDVDDIPIAALTDPQVEEAHFVRLTTHRLHQAMGEERARLATRPGMPPPSAPPPQRPSVPV